MRGRGACAHRRCFEQTLPDLQGERGARAPELDLASVADLKLHRAQQVDKLYQRLAQVAVRWVREEEERTGFAVEQDRSHGGPEIAVLAREGQSEILPRPEGGGDGGDVARAWI